MRDKTPDIHQSAVFAGRNGLPGCEIEPRIFTSVAIFFRSQGVRDKTTDIRQSPVFAGRNGQPGYEIKNTIFTKTLYLLVGTAS